MITSVSVRPGALLLLAVVSLGCAPEEVDHAFDYRPGLSDTLYLFRPLPDVAAGTGFIEPTFGTAINRMTDVARGHPPTDASGITNEYARFDPTNADGSLLLLAGTDSTWYLFDALSLTFIRKVLGQSAYEPRWHPSDPHSFFFTTDARLYRYDVARDRRELLYDFKQDYPDATWVNGRGEGDVTLDGRYFAFCVTRYDEERKKVVWLDWIIFDNVQREIIASYEKTTGLEATSANTVTMSMNGEYVVVEQRPTLVFDRAFRNRRELPGRHGHGDLALSADGRDVFVSQDTSTDFITMVYLDTLEEVNVMKIPFSHNPVRGRHVSYEGFHVSGNNAATPGWVLVSTYGDTDRPTYWSDASLFLLELKENGRHWRIAHTAAKKAGGGKDYFAEAFATINRAGTKVYWGTNRGITGKKYSDVFQVTLPKHWQRDLGAMTEGRR